jgi:hypothetical protein
MSATNVELPPAPEVTVRVSAAGPLSAGAAIAWNRARDRGALGLRVVAEAYAGDVSVAVIEYVSDGRTCRAAATEHGSCSLNGLGALTTADDAVAKRCRHYVEIAVSDAQLLPQLVGLVDRIPAGRADALLRPAGIVELGDVVYVHGFGYWRRGIVVKVAKVRAVVAYTTPSSPGTVYRPNASFSQIRVPAEVLS